jgi:hypothetical protein
VDPHVGLDPREFYLPFRVLQDGYPLSDLFDKVSMVAGVRESSVILLLVYMVTVRGLISIVCIDPIASSALIMASCSAWLFEHLLSNFSFIWGTISFPIKTAAPDPTPCSYLFPSVYAYTVVSL